MHAVFYCNIPVVSVFVLRLGLGALINPLSCHSSISWHKTCVHNVFSDITTEESSRVSQTLADK